MGRHSPLSISKEKKYLIIFFITLFMALIATFFLSLRAQEKGLMRWHYVKLYAYQLQKIRNIDRVDILFVGDSSLGNAIDARQWTHDLGVPTASLALTGVFGYAGSTSMLLRVLQKTTPKVVVLFQTIDMMARAPSDKAWVMTMPLGFNWYIKSIFETFIDIEKARRGLQDLIFPQPVTFPEGFAAADYVPQGVPKYQSQAEPGPTPFKLSDINREKVRYLKRFVNICQKKNLTCVYMHGPVTDVICRYSDAYLKEVNRIISKAGIPVVAETPECIPWEKTGDSMDHVGIPFKQEYSQKYLEKLSHYLGQMPQPQE